MAGAQTPLAHSAAVGMVQGCPDLKRHAPIASQVFVAAGHESVSSAFLTWEHVPGVAPLQVMHISVASHLTSQQNPSAQKVLWQLVASPPGHACPCAALQIPEPLQLVVQVPTGTSSVVPFGMSAQVPLTPSAHD